MRTLASFSLALFLTGGLFAQSHLGSSSGFGNVVFPGTGHPPANRSVSGFGNVVFPGTPAGPRLNNTFSITDPNFARGLGNTVAGRPPQGPNGPGRGFRRSQFVYVPYA